MTLASTMISIVAAVLAAVPLPAPPTSGGGAGGVERAGSPGGGFAAIVANVDADGKELYRKACASCHGLDGKGVERSKVAFDIPVPDFSDCSFASREPDADWLAVAHQGGPVRGFARTMPAFGEAFSEAQLQEIIDHLRTMCSNRSWPRGELNLPRPLVTEKAYPEDEAVVTFGSNTEGPARLTADFVYEKRFGPRNQIELKLPTVFQSTGGGLGNDHEAGLGDISLGVKRALWHSVASGSIVSLGGEVGLPTGRRRSGLGSGTYVFEPFLAYGQVIRGDGFLHLQALAEFPADEKKAEREVAWRGAFGWSFARNRFGRVWTPMAELLGARALESGAGVEWDIVPQFQVTLSTRQHVMANIGARLPLTDARSRPTQLVVYLLWDWFDGSFFDGW